MFLPSSHGEVGDGVVVGLEDLGVVEDLVSKRVEPVQGHPDIRGRYPFLEDTRTHTYGHTHTETEEKETEL